MPHPAERRIDQLTPSRADEVWAYEFFNYTDKKEGRLVVMAVVDDFTQECLALESADSFTAPEAATVLTDLISIRARPSVIRSGLVAPVFATAIAQALGNSLTPIRFVNQNRSWYDGGLERFLRRLRDADFVAALDLDLPTLQRQLQDWQLDYNHRLRQWRLGWLTPSQFASQERDAAGGLRVKLIARLF